MNVYVLLQTLLSVIGLLLGYVVYLLFRIRQLKGDARHYGGDR